MVLEESNVGAAGGNINVYLRKNLNFDILERYMPKKSTYHSHRGEKPDFNFVNNHLINTNEGRTEEHYYLTENNTIYYDIVQNI